MTTVALVTCPCFAFGSPPLALASLQAQLCHDGVKTVLYDLDFMFMRDRPAAFQALYQVFSIAHERSVDRVQYVVRPELLLMALFGEQYSEKQRSVHAAELAVVAEVQRYLARWAQQIVSSGARAVAISAYVSTLPSSLLFARALKDIAPDVPVAVGGPGVGQRAIQEWVLRLGGVDVCATGEGERVVSQLCRAMLSGSGYADVPGLTWLSDGAVVNTHAPPLIALSELLTPDFSGLPVPGRSLTSYRSNPLVNTRWFGTALPIATTRGCVMRCSFCSETNYWQRYRYRSVEAVVNEISELVERWGVRQFLFGDSLLNGSSRWLEAFADLCVERELGVTFLFAYMRPTRLTSALLHKLWDAGFRLISLGLETASQQQLVAMKKGTTVEEVRQVVLDALDVGISVNISILCGFPRETSEQVMESVRFVQTLHRQALARSGSTKESGLTVHAGSSLRVEPASGMYHDPEGSGIELHDVAPDLPAGLQHLHTSLAPLLQRWTCSVSSSEIDVRCRLLFSLNKEPRTIFLEEPLDSWIDEHTVIVPTRAAQVLRASDGGLFLAGAGQILAQIDQVGADAWPLFSQGSPYSVIRDTIGADDLHLRQVVLMFLQLRLVYVDDFVVSSESSQ